MINIVEYIKINGGFYFFADDSNVAISAKDLAVLVKLGRVNLSSKQFSSIVADA